MDTLTQAQQLAGDLVLKLRELVSEIEGADLANEITSYYLEPAQDIDEGLNGGSFDSSGNYIDD